MNAGDVKKRLLGLQEIIPPEQILWDEPMRNHTSFRIGGPADALLMPRDPEELARVIRYCREFAVPYYVIGQGTNLLVRDGGVRGAVIKLASPLDNITFQGMRAEAGAGATLRELCRQAMERGLSGLEFACGIPGSVGGAVCMNAGAYDGEMKDVVVSARVLDENGSIEVWDAERLGFGYRSSALQGRQAVILSAAFLLKPDNPEAIRERMEDYDRRRRARQPLDLPSAGSVFRRPPGRFVGPMIEELGLKGYRVNDAQVSEMHAGFIVNRGQARAADVLRLVEIIREKVMEKFQVWLELEIKVIGEE